MADVKYVVKADTKGAVTGIKNVDKAVKGMKTQAGQAQSPMKGMWKQVAGGIGVTALVSQGLKIMIGFMKGSVTAAQEQELAEKGLMDALASTGREVPVNSEHFKRYASELQQATLYGDEQILSAQSLMLQLTDLDQKGLDRATAGALGMATVFKTDLKSATNLIAKALAGNYGALSRYGISVADLNTEEEKRASLLDQLTVLYERAKGEVDTYGGTVTQLKNTFGDFQEKIGDVIVKSESLRGAIGSIQDLMANFIASGTMDDWATKFDKIVANVPIFKALKDSIFILNLEMEGQIAQQKAATETGKAWYDFLKDSDEALNILGVDLYEAMRNLAGFNKEVDESGSTYIPKLATAVKEATLIQMGMNDVVEDGEIWLAEMAMQGEETGGVLKEVFKNIGLDYFDMNDDIEEDTRTTIQNKISPLWDNLGTDLSRSFGNAFEDILTEGSDFNDAMVLLVGGLKDSVIGFFGDMVTGFLKNNVFKMMADEATKATSSVTSTIGGLAKGGAGAAAGAGPGALAMGLGAAAGTLIAGLITGKGGPSSEDSWHFKATYERVHNIRDLLRIDFTDILHHHGNQLEASRMHLFEIQQRADVRNTLLRDIKKNLEGVPSGQEGLNFQSGSQGGLVRYHPNEQVNITPNVNLNQQFQTVVIEKNDKYIIKVVQDNLNRRNIRVPAGAIG